MVGRKGHSWENVIHWMEFLLQVNHRILVRSRLLISLLIIKGCCVYLKGLSGEGESIFEFHDTAMKISGKKLETAKSLLRIF